MSRYNTCSGTESGADTELLLRQSKYFNGARGELKPRECEYRCVVIEDSNIGVRAARAAGMRCVVTVSSYTKDEDFALADAVFDKIEDNFTVDDLTTPGTPLPSMHLQ